MMFVSLLYLTIVETFTPTRQDSLDKLPEFIQSHFPAYLTHKSGLDISVINLMRTCFNSGMSPNKFHGLLVEFHTRNYHSRMLNYYSHFLNEKLKGSLFLPSMPEVFPSFDGIYGGYVPSGKYLQNTYLRWHDRLRKSMDNEVMKIVGKILKSDHTFQVAKLMAKV